MGNRPLEPDGGGQSSSVPNHDGPGHFSLTQTASSTSVIRSPDVSSTLSSISAALGDSTSSTTSTATASSSTSLSTVSTSSVALNSSASSLPTVISSSSGLSAPTSGIYDTNLSPTSTPPSASSKTVTIITTTVTTPIMAPSVVPSRAPVNKGVNGSKLAEILVPVVVVIALIPLLYLCYLRQRSKRSRRRVPELRLPQETTLLHSRDDSISRSTPSPFSDVERIRSGSLGMDDQLKFNSSRVSERPSSEIFRVPSPVPPSSSQPGFHAHESWPLRSVPADRPPSYENQAATLRPPSSIHDRGSHRPRTASSTEEYPSLYRASDTISELSFDHDSHEPRTRELDEMSVVSALESDDASNRHSQHMI